MNKILQICLIISSLAVLVFVLYQVRKNKINIHYSMIWIVLALIISVISIFPGIMYKVSEIVGFEKPVNAIFLIMIFLLYCLSFYIYLKISRHNEDIINLNYELASLKKRI